jgi:hypothetical protein
MKKLIILLLLIIISCTTVEKPMAIKYEYIPYPSNPELITFDESVDINTVPKITLIHEIIILQGYIKKLIKRSDLIDYLYFNVNQEHLRYKNFSDLNTEDINVLKNKYLNFAKPIEDVTNDILKKEIK